eukprot:CAMPEP_0170613030 /NCGR_PEP_ID=MMETSP0224-20130122/24049_1 /TAXON_ID=285029 /ORGANISM="Togula jolla, Strain CCCM 725" /LENGTH=272 /DNA_ID=CAMNT_0010938593 /DNA_START=116 /DNA_END=934 /DNA_ORIENTATION=+
MTISHDACAAERPAGRCAVFRPHHARAVPRENLVYDSSRTVADQPKTTAMLRNIPNKYTQNLLLAEVESMGFGDSYNLFYLPMDVKNHLNVGYAFINFLCPSDMLRFTETFTDYTFQHHSSRKVGIVSPAHIQGLVENLLHFSNRAVTWSRNSLYRPIVKIGGQHRDLCDVLQGLQHYDWSPNGSQPRTRMRLAAKSFIPRGVKTQTVNTGFATKEAGKFDGLVVVGPPGLTRQDECENDHFQLDFAELLPSDLESQASDAASAEVVATVGP